MLLQIFVYFCHEPLAKGDWATTQSLRLRLKIKLPYLTLPYRTVPYLGSFSWFSGLTRSTKNNTFKFPVKTETVDK